MSEPLYQNSFFTYGDYAIWPEDERWEIIDGEAFNMSPAPGMTHQKISGEVFAQIHNFLEGKDCKVFAAPFDVLLPAEGETTEDCSTVVQPDISIICDNSKLSEKGCTGAPDAIIEIVSPHGASRDQIKKRQLYEKKGVPEYWIIHPADRILWKYVLENNGSYGRPDVFDSTGRPEMNALPGFRLDLAKVFGPEEAVRTPPAGYKPPPPVNRG